MRLGGRGKGALFNCRNGPPKGRDRRHIPDHHKPNQEANLPYQLTANPLYHDVATSTLRLSPPAHTPPRWMSGTSQPIPSTPVQILIPLLPSSCLSASTRRQAYILAMPPKQPKTPQKVAPTNAPSAQPTPKVEPVITPDETTTEPLVESSQPTDPVTGRKLAYPLPTHISPTTINNAQSFLRLVILGLITGAAVGSRLFAVIRFESVIHELCVY